MVSGPSSLLGFSGLGVKNLYAKEPPRDTRGGVQGTHLWKLQMEKVSALPMMTVVVVIDTYW